MGPFEYNILSEADRFGKFGVLLVFFAHSVLKAFQNITQRTWREDAESTEKSKQSDQEVVVPFVLSVDF